MNKVIVTEFQYKRLIEYFSNGNVMDLDIYSQPMQTDTDNGNREIVGASEEIIDSLEELIAMFKGGKKTSTDFKRKLYKSLDDIKKTHSNIKYEK